MISGSSSSRSSPGMNDTASPTAASSNGAWMFRRSATMVTPMAKIITMRICETMGRSGQVAARYRRLHVRWKV